MKLLCRLELKNTKIENRNTEIINFLNEKLTDIDFNQYSEWITDFGELDICLYFENRKAINSNFSCVLSIDIDVDTSIDKKTFCDELIKDKSFIHKLRLKISEYIIFTNIQLSPDITQYRSLNKFKIDNNVSIDDIIDSIKNYEVEF